MHNNVYDGVNLQLPFPDAMQEFRVETSSQNAQNGYKAGGTASVATKAGTNAFHGDVFEFARHHQFNSTSPFAAVNPATGERYTDGLVRNQFGGVIGGPIVQRQDLLLRRLPGDPRQRRRRPTSSPSSRRRRCWQAISRPWPRRSAARRAT